VSVSLSKAVARASRKLAIGATSAPDLTRLRSRARIRTKPSQKKAGAKSGCPSFSRSVPEGGVLTARFPPRSSQGSAGPRNARPANEAFLQLQHGTMQGDEGVAEIESRGGPSFPRPLCFVMRRDTFSRKAWAASIRNANPGSTGAIKTTRCLCLVDKRSLR
jgi:hypothetical protein